MTLFRSATSRGISAEILVSNTTGWSAAPPAGGKYCSENSFEHAYVSNVVIYCPEVTAILWARNCQKMSVTSATRMFLSQFSRITTPLLLHSMWLYGHKT